MAGIKAACQLTDWLSAACSARTHVAENILYLLLFSAVRHRTRSVCVMSCEWAVVINKCAWTVRFSLYLHKEASVLLLLILLVSFPPFPLLHSNHSQFLRSLFHSPLLPGFSYWYSEDERWWKWGYAGKLSPWPCVEGMKGIITVYFIPRFSCGISMKSPFQESK